MKYIRTIKNKWEDSAAVLMGEHPFIGIMVIVFGMPAAMVAAVFLATAMVMLPISSLGGWM